MKDYPFIKFAISFIVGILVHKVFQPEALQVLLIILFLLVVFSIVKISGKVLEIDKKNTTAKLSVELNDQLIFPTGSTLFFLYDNGHFNLVKEVVVPQSAP